MFECGTVFFPFFGIADGLLDGECTFALGHPQYDFWYWAIRQPEYQRFVEERELPSLVEAWFFSPHCTVARIEQCGFEFLETEIGEDHGSVNQ